jgi:hypothetical protein
MSASRSKTDGVAIAQPWLPRSWKILAAHAASMRIRRPQPSTLVCRSPHHHQPQHGSYTYLALAMPATETARSATPSTSTSSPEQCRRTTAVFHWDPSHRCLPRQRAPPTDAEPSPSRAPRPASQALSPDPSLPSQVHGAHHPARRRHSPSEGRQRRR